MMVFRLQFAKPTSSATCMEANLGLNGMLLEVMTPLKSHLQPKKDPLVVKLSYGQNSPVSVNTECGSWTGCEHRLVAVKVVVVVKIVVILIPVVVHDVEYGHDVTGSEADIIILSSNEGVVSQEVRRD